MIADFNQEAGAGPVKEMNSAIAGKKKKEQNRNTSLCLQSSSAYDFSLAVFIVGCKHGEGSTAGCFTLLVILLILLNLSFLLLFHSIYFLSTHVFP